MLSDLDAGQVEELARRYGLPWGAQEIEGVMRLVGGHPYLARLLMHRAALHRVPLGECQVTIEGKGVPESYASEKLSALKVKVAEGENTFGFELVSD